jgi:ABC-type antimicrobial peptide transport system permease subunit
VARAQGELDQRSTRLTPARSGPLARLGSGLCIVLLAVLVGVLLAVAVGGILGLLGAIVGNALDR